MKKFFAALLCAGIVAVAATGCGFSDASLESKNPTTQPSETSAVEATADEVKAENYKNNLDGIVKYFTAKKYISNAANFTEMDAASIGAKSGKKFTESYEGKNVVIELYEYASTKFDENENDVRSSVKNNGTFVIYNMDPVTAYVSDNGKFLLIYTDASIDKNNPDKTTANYKRSQEVIKNFNAFRK